MHRISQSTLRSCVFLALVAAGTIFFRLGALPLTGADEPRYARIAEEMYREGSWITPLLEGRPWLEKPPLYYWITIPFHTAWGNNETAARLGPAFSGLLAAAAIFWLGTRIWNRLTGLLGASIVLTCVGVAGLSRGASTDMPMSACLTVALSILMAAAIQPKFASWKLAVGYIFLGLSVLGKGPVSLVLAGGVLLCFWFLDERGGSFKKWRVVPGLVLAAAVAIPWFLLAFRQNGYAFIATFFINHNLARYVSDIHHHEKAFYYYVPIFLGLIFPWTGWLVLLIPRSIRASLRAWRSWDPRTLFLAGWILFPLVFFSFSTSKLAGYILPCLPPFALLLGAGFSKWQAGGSSGMPTRAASWAFFLGSAGVAVAAPLFFNSAYGGQWPVGLIISGAAIIPALAALRYGLQNNAMAAFKATVLQSFFMITLTTLFAFPILGPYLSAKDIALKALSVRQAGEPIVGFIYGSHSLDYYSGYQVQDTIMDTEALKQLVHERGRALVVVETRLLAPVQQMEGTNKVVVEQKGKLVAPGAEPVKFCEKIPGAREVIAGSASGLTPSTYSSKLPWASADRVVRGNPAQSIIRGNHGDTGPRLEMQEKKSKEIYAKAV